MKSRLTKQLTLERRAARERQHQRELFRKEMVSLGVPSKTVRELRKEGKTDEQIRKIVLG